MIDEKKKAAVEGILFTMGDAVETEAIATALSLTRDEVNEIAEALAAECEREDRGIMVTRPSSSSFRIASRTGVRLTPKSSAS